MKVLEIAVGAVLVPASLSKNFCSRPGCRRKSLVSSSGVGSGRHREGRREGVELLKDFHRRPGGVGVFHAKGRGSKSSCPPSKVYLPWVFREGSWDVHGILPGCPGPLGVSKKFVQKKFVRLFLFLYRSSQNCYCRQS